MSLLSAVDTAKELLDLNKFFVAGLTLWGLMMATMETIPSLKKGCPYYDNAGVFHWGFLNNVTVAAIALWLCGAVLDSVVEFVTDSVYSLSADEKEDKEKQREEEKSRRKKKRGKREKIADEIEDTRDEIEAKCQCFPTNLREKWQVPGKYQGIYWTFIPSALFWTTKETNHHVYAWFLLFSETMFRLIGNAFLIALIVFGSLFNYEHEFCDPLNASTPVIGYSSIGSENPWLIWTVIPLTIARVAIATTYPKREVPPPSPTEVTVVNMEAINKIQKEDIEKSIDSSIGDSKNININVNVKKEKDAHKSDNIIQMEEVGDKSEKEKKKKNDNKKDDKKDDKKHKKDDKKKDKDKEKEKEKEGDDDDDSDKVHSKSGSEKSD